MLSLNNVPSPVLAALNHLAICAVNPTFFEGGFPFTFSEAYSVGTPSVMGAIPVTLDKVINPKLRKHMLFDPTNIEDMVEKIDWAIHHRDELLMLQKPLYERIHSRTWEMVANEYLQVFEDTENG